MVGPQTGSLSFNLHNLNRLGMGSQLAGSAVGLPMPIPGRAGPDRHDVTAVDRHQNFADHGALHRNAVLAAGWIESCAEPAPPQRSSNFRPAFRLSKFMIVLSTMA